jgi:hypothetical protein
LAYGKVASVGGLFIPNVAYWHFWDMPTGRDDVSFRGEDRKSSVNASGGDHANNQNLGVREEVETHLVGVLKDRFDRNEFHSNELVYKTGKLGAEQCAP